MHASAAKALALVSVVLLIGCGRGGKLTIANGFIEGTEFRANGERGTITLVEVGTIAFPSGKVTPKDTMVLDEEAPLDREVPRQEGKATAAVAKFSSGDERVAFLRVRFRDDTVVKHELAKRLISDKWHESYKEAYPVDSGHGGFVDHAAQGDVNKAAQARSTPGAKQLHEDIERRWKNTWTWANVEMIPGIRMLVVSSGFGDGAYKTFYGFNTNGDIVELVTDFGVF